MFVTPKSTYWDITSPLLPHTPHFPSPFLFPSLLYPSPPSSLHSFHLFLFFLLCVHVWLREHSCHSVFYTSEVSLHLPSGSRQCLLFLLHMSDCLDLRAPVSASHLLHRSSGITAVCCSMPGFSVGTVGPNLGPVACLHGKCFTYWAVSPAPDLISDRIVFSR